jgi:uncharacterized membrane protein
MQLRLDNAGWIWLALAAVPAAVLALRAFTSMSLSRRWSAVILRAALFSLLALLLAGVSSVRVTDRLAVVGVVDVSGSVRLGAAMTDETGRPIDGVEAARRFLLKATDRRGPDDLVGLVVFDGRGVAVATPTRAGIEGRALEPTGTDGTNIEAGLTTAMSLLPADAAGRIVLFSDGVETRGRAMQAAGLAASRAGASGRRGVPIDVVPLGHELSADVFVESVDAPPRAASESTVNVRVVLQSTGPATGTLELSHEGVPVDLDPASPANGRRLTLAAGPNVVVFPVELGPGRIHRFQANFTPDGPDQIAANNRAAGFTISPGKGAVLLVDGVSQGEASGEGSTLAKSLRESGVDVRVVPAGGIPTDLVALESFDSIILQNVPADEVPEKTQEMLAAFVRDLGGGLLMVGGPDSFGAGGWKGSKLEPLLPVLLDLPDKLVTPEAAVVFVLDTSGSMRRHVMGSTRTQQGIVNQSAAMAVKMLDKRDLVGVIAFDNNTRVVVPLGPNADAESTAGAILRLSPDGGTNMGPAMTEGIRQLMAADAKTKHLIVLSDGKSMNEETLPPEASRAAGEGIRVSSIAVGDDADVATMRRIAELGGGTFYNVINPSLLPKVFLKAVRVVRSPLIRESPFTPLLTRSQSPFVAGISELPPLNGLSLTQVRRDPGIVTAMVSPEGEPILAHWNVELGQVAAFTSDAHRWAAPWLSWPGYRTFWAQSVRLLSRLDSGRNSEAQVVAQDGRLRLRLDASDEAGAPLDGLDVPATVYSPEGEPSTVALVQTGPGRYEAAMDAPNPGVYVAVMKPRRGEERLPPAISGVSVSSSEEWRRPEPDPAFLARLAEATGGRVLALSAPDSASLFDRSGVTPREAFTSLWRPVLIAAIIVLLFDIATRRVAWDRWITPDLGADLGRAEAMLRTRGAAAARSLDELRRRDSASARTPLQAPTALGEQDARSLADAARDRRYRTRLDENRRAREAGAKPPAKESPAPADEGSLLAAKKRAREKFGEE